MRGTAVALVVVMCCMSLATPATAQKSKTIRFVSPLVRIQEALDADDLDQAIAIAQRHLEHHPEDAAALYLTACVRAAQGEIDLAAARLMQAVRSGFNNLSHIRRDARLEPLHGHRAYEALFEARQAADGWIAQQRVEAWRGRVDPDRYTLHKDDARYFNVLTNLDDQAITGVLETMDEHVTLLTSTLFEPAPPQWTFVALLDAEDGRHLLDRSHTNGVYRHNQRELIALDTDVALRHELVHRLHQHDMDRLGQQHPVWIEEGLATLFEQAPQPHPSGRLRFEPTVRDHIARQLGQKDRLLSWETMLILNPRQFGVVSHRSYAQARSMMRFIANTSDLSAWYRTYVELHAEDPTGTLALERHFRMSLTEIEAQWRQWVMEQPIVVGSRETVAPDPQIEPADAAAAAVIAPDASNDAD